MIPKKSLRSRYSLSQINNNYLTVAVGITCSAIRVFKPTSSLDAGYVWAPYIISSSPGFVIESNQEIRKSKIRNIIDKL